MQAESAAPHRPTAVRPRTARRLRLRLPATPSDWLAHAALVAGALLMLFPFYWMLTTALKATTEANAFPPVLLPSSFHPENFTIAWGMAPFAQYFLNSAIMSLAQVALVLFTSTLAAYAFARFEFLGKNLIFTGFLATMMVPFEVTLVPNFIIIKNLGWYNSYWALTVPWAANVFGVFLLRQHFLNLPKDLWDAARMDGCSDFRFFLTIALPLAKPALATVALVVFLGAWNSLLWPLIMTGSEEMRVVQAGLSAFTNETGTRVELLMAAALLTVAPIAVLYFAAQRYFVESIASSGSKG